MLLALSSIKLTKHVYHVRKELINQKRVNYNALDVQISQDELVLLPEPALDQLQIAKVNYIFFKHN